MITILGCRGIDILFPVLHFLHFLFFSEERGKILTVDSRFLDMLHDSCRNSIEFLFDIQKLYISTYFIKWA